MNICNDNEEVKDTYKHPELIGGHLYENLSMDDKIIYIYGELENKLIALGNGNSWSRDPGFGYRKDKWQDVTDQYCLKKVK